MHTQHAATTATPANPGGGKYGGGMPAELVRRLEAIENEDQQGAMLTRNDYRWLFVVTVVIPVLMLAGGWWL